MSDDINTDEILNESEELFEHHRIVADPGQQPLRIDKFLMSRIANISRNKLQMASTSGYVRLDGKPVKSNFKVRPDQVITVELPQPVYDFELVAEEMDLNIIYEDDTVIVLNKRTDLVVHPGHGNHTGTLVNGILHHLQNLPSVEGSPTPRPGLVHRLDKDTSGILLIAKGFSNAAILAEAFRKHLMQKTYIAITSGVPTSSEGTLIHNIGKELSGIFQIVKELKNGGKRAETYYKVIKSKKCSSLIEFEPTTGRMHQIRFHAKFLGCPIIGDKKYGGNKNSRMLLHKRKLVIKKLVFGQQIEITSNVPKEFYF
jgi:23S rRNA pseudouridine1911/1915/1917 synthase